MSTPGDTGAAPDPVAALLAAEAATRSGTEGTAGPAAARRGAGAGRAADGRATERGGRSSGKERSSASRRPRRADGDAGESGSPAAGGPLRRLLAGVLLPVAALGLAAADLLVRVPDGTTATAWVTAALIAAWAACGAATSWAPERTPQWQQAAGAVLGAVALGADRLSARFAAEAAHGPHRLAVAAGMVAAALMVAVSVHLLLSLPDGRLRSRGRLACALTAYGTALAAGGALAAAGQEIPAWLAVLIWTLALLVVFPAARNRYDHAAARDRERMQWAAIGAVAGCGLVLAATVLNLLVSWPAPAAPAKMAHAQRPATMPKGTPMSSAAAARTVAFHATTAWTWRLVSPRVFSAARSTYAARYVAC